MRYFLLYLCYTLILFFIHILKIEMISLKIYLKYILIPNRTLKSTLGIQCMDATEDVLIYL